MITVVGAAFGTGTSLSLSGIPWTDDDLAVAFLARSTASAFTVTGIFELLDTNVGGVAPQGWAGYRTLVAGDSTFAYTPTTGIHPWGLVVVRGHSVGDPIEYGDVLTDSVSNDNQIVAPSVNANSGAMLVSAYIVNQGVTGTPPGGQTEQVDTAGAAGNPPRLMVNTELLSSSGASGTRSETISSVSSANKIGISIAVRAPLEFTGWGVPI